MYRCINDLFGYCKSQPQCQEGATGSTPTTPDTTKEAYPYLDIACTKNPRTCKKYLTFSQVVPPQMNSV